jgi:hypothetical protein
MDQTRAREIAKDAAEQGSKTVNEATQRVGEQVQPALDQAKAAAQDLGNRASEPAGRPWTGRASLSRALRLKPNRLRAISTTRALSQENTSVNMLRNNP